MTDRDKMIRLIPLTQGMVALVDNEYFDFLNQWKWYAKKGKKTYYAVRNISINGKRKGLFMHREIMKTPDHLDCDHAFHNGLDNRKFIEVDGEIKQNLRNCTPLQNSWNLTPKGSNTGYTGVHVQKDGTIRVQIQVNGEKKHIGCFKTAEDAARAYDKAALEYHGEFAILNFKE